MPSFRSPKAQAYHAIIPKTQHGTPRYGNKTSVVIHSVGTERNYRQALKAATKWLQDNCAGDLQTMTSDQARQYLTYRANQVRQKTLDLDRQALQLHLGQHLYFVPSSLPPSKLAMESRAYTTAQVEEICRHQPTHYAFSTLIAYHAGLRAAELLTLRQLSEKSASQHRIWSINRFIGRDNHALYTVTGKGGLVREVAVPKDLVEQLQARRFSAPIIVSDRGVYREKHYDLAGGKKWSADFSRASKEALGFSLGAHGLRHSYAQERVIELQGQGFSWDEAKGIVAQELGHFAMNTTEVYLR